MASGDTLVMWTPLCGEQPASNGAPADIRNGIPVLEFDGSTDEETVFSAVLPRLYSGGGVTVTLHIAYTSATSGTSRWQTAFERGSTDMDADSFESFNSGSNTPSGTSGITTTTAIAHASGAEMDSLAAGERFRLKVRRDADGTSGTDDIGTDAELVCVEVRET